MVKPSQGGAKQGGLARFVGAPGGLTYEDAVRRGEDGVEFMKDVALAELDKAVGALSALLEAMGEAPAEPARLEAMALANTIATVAGVYERAALGQIAQELFNLIDEFNCLKAWDRGAAMVHGQALVMAHAKAASPAEMAQMLEGLARVRSRALRFASRTVTR